MFGYLSTAPGLWYALALPVLSWLLTTCLLIEAGNIGAAAHALTLAGSGLLAGLLLWPMLWRRAEPDLADLTRWLILSLGGGLPLLLATPAVTWTSLALPLLAGVLVLFLFLGACTLALQRLAHCPGHGAQRALVCFLLLTTTAPLWLGPLAGRLANLGFTNLVVALSPASYLAGLIGYDLFRGVWFYAHTPLGGLRYAYPELTAMTLFYCGTAALLLSLSGMLARRITSHPDAVSSYHHLPEEPTP